MTSLEIRRQFLDFFRSKGHEIVESSPVVPHDDPTLMFTNAGMNQFKDVFLSTGTRDYKRAADTQKCIRAGGKHNDLDDVGQDTYHHTFFEMLGNWSFGDYFKKEAIEWAWELLTEVWGIDKTRLHATYFKGKRAAGFSPRGLSDCEPPPDGDWELEPDFESRDLWLSVTDIDPSHVHPGDMKDNFWEMGDVGPCGPCSEIHIDLTPDKSGAKLVNAGDARVIELWNLVFIQFNRAADGTLSPLPAKHVDTGMGFERLCAVLQGMEQDKLGRFSNYDTDVFTPIFDAIQKRTGAPAYTGLLPGTGREQGNKGSRDRDDTALDPSIPRSLDPSVMIDVSYRVIADHLRCLVFAITDGGIPDRSKAGSILRSILRRAVYYGSQYMRIHEPFLCDLVGPFVDHMGDPFPGLRTHLGRKTVEHVAEMIRDEEQSFLRTLDRGIALFEEAVNRAIGKSSVETAPDFAHFVGIEPAILEDDPPGTFVARYALSDRSGTMGRTISPAHARRIVETGQVELSGDDAFKLHATYGFPIDLTQRMSEECGLAVDIGEYERLMDEAREKARGSISATMSLTLSVSADLTFTVDTDDNPKYAGLECEAKVMGFVVNDKVLQEPPLAEGQKAGVILDRTPFYAEQGGQVGDSGTIETDTGTFDVEKTVIAQAMILHLGKVRSGTIPHQQDARCSVSRLRIPTTQNHTSTHIMNWALREVLGDHVQQKGSLVDPEKTRFDFSHKKPLSDDELARIEDLCNEQIASDLTVYTEEVDQEQARKINTLRAVFGEKYPDRVRVVSIGVPIGDADSDDPDTLLGNPTDAKWMQYSVEFCGGTHLKKSSEAGRFVLTTEEGVAKCVRRLVGISGDAATKALELGNSLLSEATALVGQQPVARSSEPPTSVGADSASSATSSSTTPSSTTSSSTTSEPPRGLKSAARDDVGHAEQSRDREGAVENATLAPLDLAVAVTALQRKMPEAVIPIRTRRRIQGVLDELQAAVKKQQKQQAAESGDAVMDRVKELFASAESLDGVTVVAGEVPSSGADALRGAIDWVRNKTDASAVFLATADGKKVTLIAGMSKVVVGKGVKAGDLIKEVAPLVGGRGGGRPDMAQGGGNDPSNIAAAVAKATDWIKGRLA